MHGSRILIFAAAAALTVTSLASEAFERVSTGTISVIETFNDVRGSVFRFIASVIAYAFPAGDAWIRDETIVPWASDDPSRTRAFRSRLLAREPAHQPTSAVRAFC